MNGIFPAGELMRELVLAIGGALLIGNLAVIVAERRRKPDDTKPKPNMKIIAMNIAIGVLLTVWGIGSLVAAK